MVLAALWFAVSVCALVVASRGVALRITEGRPGLDAALVSCVAAWGILTAVCEVLGAAHIFNVWGALAGVVAAAVVVLTLVGAPRARTTGARLSAPTALAVAALAWGALSVSLGSPSQEFDTNRYHVVNAAHWLDTGETWSLPYAQPGDHTAADPGGSELLAAWAMLPTHDDRIAYAFNTLFAAVVVLGVAVLTREAGGSPVLGAAAGLAVVAAPAWYTTQTHSLMSDLPVGAGIVAALAFLGLARSAPERRRWWVLAGLGLGLAVGSKYTALPPTAVIIALSLVAGVVRRRLRPPLTLVVTTLVAGGFWYLRNTIATGDPLFPGDVEIAGHRLLGPGAQVTFSPVSLAGHLTAGRWSALGTWWWVALSYIGPLAPLLGLGLVAGLVVARTRRLALLCAALLAVYAVTPNSGGGANPTDLSVAEGFRFALPAMALAAVVTVRALARWRGAAVLVVGAALVFDAVRIARGSPDRTDVLPTGFGVGRAAAVLAAALVTALLVGALRERLRIAGAAPAAVAVAVALLLTPAPDVPASPVVAALQVASERGAAVVVVNVAGMRSVLGPDLRVRPVSVGAGQVEGARGQVLDATSFQRLIDGLHPAYVVVGDDTRDVPRPDWSPPAGWRVVGRVADGVVYQPTG